MICVMNEKKIECITIGDLLLIKHSLFYQRGIHGLGSRVKGNAFHVIHLVELINVYVHP
jgi:hypothetical protein